MWQPSVWLEELLGPLIVHKTFWWVPKEISHPGKLSTCYLPQISNPDDWDVKTTMGSPTRFFPCPYFGCKCKRDRSCLSALLSTWTWVVEDRICTASKHGLLSVSFCCLHMPASDFEKVSLVLSKEAMDKLLALLFFLLVSQSSVSCLHCRLPLKHGEREACHLCLLAVVLILLLQIGA